MLRRLALASMILLFAGPLMAQASAGFIKINTANVTGTTFTDSGCQNQTTCYYQVTAADAQGHESPPAVCNTSTLCFGGNQAVAVMPSSGVHTVTVSWTASTSTVVVGYNIYRAVGPLAPSGLGVVVN